MDVPPIKLRNGYNVIYGVGVHPAQGLDEVVDYLVKGYYRNKSVRVKARTSLTQERELTGPESAYVVAKASELIQQEA